MPKVKVEIERCKSCGYCVDACPKKAISFVKVEGELYDNVTVDDEKCIGCGICYQVCPDYVFEIIDEGGASN